MRCRKITAENCVICGNSTAVVQSFVSNYNNKEYFLLECRSCEVQFWTPLEHPKAKYYEEEVRIFYKEIHKGSRSNLDVRHKKFFKDFFGNMTNMRVLDVGCSDGLFLEKLQSMDMNNEVWGIDIDLKAIEIAKKRRLNNVYCLDIDTFITESQKLRLQFDIVTMFDVLEHLTDPLNVLNGLKKLLSPNGKIIGTVPNRGRFLRNHIVTDFPPHHFFRFDKRSLRNLFNLVSLGVEKTDIFEYGYAGRVITNTLIKKGKQIIKENILFTHNYGEKNRTNNEISDGTHRSLKGKVLNLFVSITLPISIMVEYSLRRGFKLYFVCTKNN